MNAVYKLSRYHVATEPIADQKRGGRVERILLGLRTGATVLVGEELWARLQDADFDGLPQATLGQLVQAELLVPADEDELSTILEANDRKARDDRTLYLVVQPTAWCQLGCSYCGQRHTRQTLDPANQDRLIARVEGRLRTGRFDGLEICWFGGEPLAGLGVMRLLTERLLEVTRRFGCRYDARIVTNGLGLTPAVAEELVREMHVRKIEITLDGTAEYHDLRRATKAGLGTFERVFGNLVALARRDDLEVFLTVRCNVDQHNRDGVLPLLRRLVEAGVRDRIGAFYVSPVVNWGNDAGDRNVPREEFARWEVEWFVEMFKLGFQVGVLPERQAANCMALAPDAELVDPEGTLFKCTEVSLVPAYEEPQEDRYSCLSAAVQSSLPATDRLGVPTGQLPILDLAPACGQSGLRNRYAIGSLERGADPARCVFGEFPKRVREGRYPCHTCAIFPVCGGMCPKKWDDGTEPCPAVRFNIRERLLLAYAMGRIGGIGGREAGRVVGSEK